LEDIKKEGIPLINHFTPTPTYSLAHYSTSNNNYRNWSNLQIEEGGEEDEYQKVPIQQSHL
jgi:hypothetical protein